MTRVELNILINEIDDTNLIKEIILLDDLRVFLITRMVKLKCNLNDIRNILNLNDDSLILIEKVCINSKFLINFDSDSQLIILSALINIAITKTNLLNLFCTLVVNKYIIENRADIEILEIFNYISSSKDISTSYIILSNPHINQLRNIIESFKICDAVLECDNDLQDKVELATSYEILKNETIEDHIQIIKTNKRKNYDCGNNKDNVSIEEYLLKVEDKNGFKSLIMELKSKGIYYFNKTDII